MASVLTAGGGAPAVSKQSSEASFVVHGAQQYLGTPYKWGGASPGGFDCSGLLQYLWGKAGVAIPRTTYQQFTSGQAVAANALRPGDALFFTGSDPMNGLPGHVGIYLGGGKFIEAPHTGAVVRVSSLQGRSDFVGARRYGAGTIPSAAVAAATTPQAAATGTIPHAPGAVSPGGGGAQGASPAVLRALLGQTLSSVGGAPAPIPLTALPALADPTPRAPVAAFSSPLLTAKIGNPLGSLAAPAFKG